MMQERQQAVMDRGGYLMCRCDRCDVEKGTEAHHLIPKGRVMTSTEEAKCLINDKRLLTMLCRDCHTGSENAHSPHVTEQLFRKQIQRYGYASVQKAFQNVLAATRMNNIGVEFPEYEGGMRA